jgi:D-amino-acid dehydrogenase
MQNPLLPRTALVVGAGVVGTACALNLQRRGVHTLLIDPISVRRAASWGNAGHIAVEQVEPLASLATLRSVPRRLFWRGGALGLPLRDVGAWAPFALRMMAASGPARHERGRAALSSALATAVEAWRRLLAEAGAGDLLREQGHFVVWESAVSAAAGRAAWRRADTGTATLRDVTVEEMQALQDLVKRPLAGAIRFLGSAQITDPGDMADALTRCFEQAGGRQVRARADAIQTDGGVASLRLQGGDVLEADALVVAAGVGSAGLLEPLGHRAPIIAERGYHIQSEGGDWPADFPPVVFEDRSLIVTRFRSGLRAASFVEFGCEDSPPDPRKWARLRDQARVLGLPFAASANEWMGARPTLPDYLPAIGRSRSADNLFYAFGHQHLGLTLAATTGEAIAAMVVGEAPRIDLSPFDIERFG